MIDLDRSVRDRRCFLDRWSLEPRRPGVRNSRMGWLFGSEPVKLLGSIDLSLQFRDVAQVVQSEGIVWVQHVRFIENRFGLAAVVFTYRVNAFAIQLLHRRHMAATRD